MVYANVDQRRIPRHSGTDLVRRSSNEIWRTGESSALVKEELQARRWSIRDNGISVTVE
jgi:hypothetical protein